MSIGKVVAALLVFRIDFECVFIAVDSGLECGLVVVFLCESEETVSEVVHGVHTFGVVEVAACECFAVVVCGFEIFSLTVERISKVVLATEVGAVKFEGGAVVVGGCVEFAALIVAVAIA